MVDTISENDEIKDDDSIVFKTDDKHAAVDEREPCDPQEFSDYKKAILRLNKDYAVTMLGSDCVVLNEYWDPINERKDIRFLSYDTFNRMLINEKCVNPWRSGSQKKYKSVSNMWLSSGYRKTYDAVLFDPSDKINRNKFYNMFQGFSVKPKKGNWSKLRDHIFDMVCIGDERLDHYVMSWMARIVQDPGGARPGTALVFRGAQGCGKGVAIRSLGKILFPHFKHLLHLSHLTGKFNQHLKDSLLLFCDEITWGGDKQAEGILKGIITEPTVRIEAKMKDSSEILSYINLAIASNNDWIVPTGPFERRFCVLDVSPDKKDDKSYFGEMYKQLECGGYEAMLYDLLHYPRMSTKELCSVPKTKGLLDQILLSFSPIQKFWYQRLCDESQLLSSDSWETDVPCYTLYNSYLDFCDTIGRRNLNVIKSQFSRSLSEICPDLKTIRKRVNGSRTYFYSFPSLTICREQFASMLGMYVDWEYQPDDFS